MQLNGFNAEEVEPQSDFEVIPAGWYKAMITDSESKETKSGTGEYLQLRFDIIEGEYENRVLFARLNLVNQNQTAVDIAQKQLSSICRAVGVMQPNDSTDLHDFPMMVKVKIRPAKDGYEASNDISAYEAADGSAAPAPSTKKSASAASSGGENKKPWEK